MPLVLFDLDGVIRKWHSLPTAAIERDFDLPPGTIEQTAFSRPLLVPAITGMISDEVWRERITEILKATYPRARPFAGGPPLLAKSIQTVFQLVERCRVRPQVALITNGTSRLRQDLDALEISNAFDFVFNSAE